MLSASKKKRTSRMKPALACSYTVIVAQGLLHEILPWHVYGKA